MFGSRSVDSLCKELLLPTLSDLYRAFDLLERGFSVRLAGGAPGLGSDTEEPSIDFISGPYLGVRSSGSTGRPKLVWRSWAAIRDEFRRGERFSGWRWASPFLPWSFAGVQVAFQAWAAQGSITSLPREISAAMPFMASCKIDGLSCTPTFLDLAIQHFARPAAWVPRQVTLGGEPLRPGAGARFRDAFPGGRFTVIYASAEHGVLLKTHRLDGWYEIASLEKRHSAWRISCGALEICRMGEWVSTGDLVEVASGLMRVIGRADRVANVAGCKVSLDDVAAAAEEVQGVRAATALAEPSPVTGQIVVVRVCPFDASTRSQLEERVMEHLRTKLPKEAWPRRLEVGPVALGPNGKRSLGANEFTAN